MKIWTPLFLPVLLCASVATALARDLPFQIGGIGANWASTPLPLDDEGDDRYGMQFSDENGELIVLTYCLAISQGDDESAIAAAELVVSERIFRPDVKTSRRRRAWGSINGIQISSPTQADPEMGCGEIAIFVAEKRAWIVLVRGRERRRAEITAILDSIKIGNQPNRVAGGD
jgi:hypothetical protein